MNSNQYALLSSEVNVLTELLNDLPEENYIERIGLEHRLEEAKKLLEAVNPYHINKKMKLTFRGAPVVGSKAISATFATKATTLFTEAIAALSAGFSRELNDRGPIPDRDVHQLMITGTAIGSFGFELELPARDESDLCPDQSVVETAIEDVRKIFDSASNGSDDDLNDMIEDVQPRAIKKIHDFLDYLNEQNALCGLEFENHSFKFSNSAQLFAAAERLRDENFHEKNVVFQGKFEGFLPISRTFEFETEDKRHIKGKISKTIADPKELNHAWLSKSVSVTFREARIGNSKPKYILSAVDDIQDGLSVDA